MLSWKKWILDGRKKIWNERYLMIKTFVLSDPLTMSEIACDLDSFGYHATLIFVRWMIWVFLALSNLLWMNLLSFMVIWWSLLDDFYFLWWQYVRHGQSMVLCSSRLEFWYLDGLLYEKDFLDDLIPFIKILSMLPKWFHAYWLTSLKNIDLPVVTWHVFLVIIFFFLWHLVSMVSSRFWWM